MPAIRKSNEAHVAEGTYRADRHAKPVTEISLPELTEPPIWLRDDLLAMKEWIRLTSLAENTGLFRDTDAAALAMYCAVYSEIAETGSAAVQTSRLAFLRQLANDLGLTPKARAAFNGAQPAKGPDAGHEREDFGDF